MRALLTIALLALLATSSLAKPQGPPNGKPEGPGGKRPPPFKPLTGTVLAAGKVKGFDGKVADWEPDTPEGKVNIVSDLDNTPMKWQVVGQAFEDDEGLWNLNSVSWAYGVVVKATVVEDVDRAGNPFNKLTVQLFNGTNKAKAILPGRLNLGKLVSITYKDERRQDRVVEIVVKPFIKIVIVQPYIKPATRFERGSYADYLRATVVLTKEPQNAPTGILVPAPVED